MNLEQILQSRDMILEPAELRAVLEAAIRGNIMLEIWLDRDKRTYTSRLFAPPDNGAAQKVWITPLEPASGNLAIRQAQQIRFLFHLGQYAISGSTHFLGVETLSATRVLCVGSPSLLRVHLQRSNPRYPLPKDRVTLVKASRLRENTLNGTLTDINLNGLGFQIPNPESGFEKGENISVEIQPAPFGLQSFKVLGTVCFKSRVRDADDPSAVLDRYGIQLAQDGQYMILRQLVEKLRRLGPL